MDNKLRLVEEIFAQNLEDLAPKWFQTGSKIKEVSTQNAWDSPQKNPTEAILIVLAVDGDEATRLVKKRP